MPGSLPAPAFPMRLLAALAFLALGLSGGAAPLEAQADDTSSRIFYLSAGGQIVVPQQPQAYRTNFDPGRGLHGSLALHLGPVFRARLTADWARTSREALFSEEFDFVLNEGDVTHLYITPDVQYFFMPPEPGIRPYLYVGPTLGRVHLDTLVSRLEGVEEILPPESHWGLGGRGGLGLEYYGSGLRVNIELGYTRIWTDEDSWALIPIRAGLVLPVAF